jgi:hypothetical protein
MATTVFHRGLVVDVITSFSNIDKRYRSLDAYRELVTSNNRKQFPRNTLVVKPMSDGESITMNREIICYPFFSSHFSLPVKPGEQVWFVYEGVSSMTNAPEQMGYWMSRVCGPNHVEDANYSFFKRDFSQEPVRAPKTTSQKYFGEDEETPDSTFVEAVTTDADEINKLLNHAQVVHRFEAVPRYEKRPGDLVLQGSNNTLIMLGEARGQYSRSSSFIKTNSNDDDIIPNMGAIDIVVGRGARPATAPTVMKNGNALGLPENDKRTNRAVEGDADFVEDAARVYLVAGTDINKKNHPDNLLDLSLPSDVGFLGFPASKKSEGSFAVVKADNLRLIARGSRKIPEAKGFSGLFNREEKPSGSIIIMKEQSTDEARGDGVSVVLHDNGTLHLSANAIKMMTFSSKSAATEPYVKYSVLSSMLTDLLVSLLNFSNILKTFSTAPGGGPVIQAVPAAAALDTTIAKLQATIVAGEMKSTLIFGQ